MVRKLIGNVFCNAYLLNHLVIPQIHLEQGGWSKPYWDKRRYKDTWLIKWRILCAGTYILLDGKIRLIWPCESTLNLRLIYSKTRCSQRLLTKAHTLLGCVKLWSVDPLSLAHVVTEAKQLVTVVFDILYFLFLSWSKLWRCFRSISYTI